ncbi:DUF1836 domain-containing protein [Metabacillus sp. RGM 3146]|uniref:DUF1836 domain-containing protein n=1 Tax=Metabacillus sp. RGM 3146 TaxID=3401092 RepID=UPI003B99A915
MTTAKLTRLEMAELLLSLKGEFDVPPLTIINKSIHSRNPAGSGPPEFLKRIASRDLPYGLSTNEIVELGNLCDFATLSSTSLQNWIKRDIRELIGPPLQGKKYSIDQAAILLTVKDLKIVYDFGTIRYLLTALFNTITDRSDDVISPVTYYHIYALLLESLLKEPSCSPLEFSEEYIIQVIEDTKKEIWVPEETWDHIEDILVLTILAVAAFHFHQRAKFFLDKHLQKQKGKLS